MLKVLGVLLVWSGCVLWGMRAAAVLYRRGKMLDDIGRGLELLERDLALSRDAMPELLKRASHRKTQQGKWLFLNCMAELEKGNSFADSWHAALDKSDLTRQDRDLLAGLSHVMGRFETDGQVQALSRLRVVLERHTEHIRRQAQSMGKVYSALGVTVGGFVSLMLV
ncbi:MAG: stage III sporulation protein AB [Oscillospiraceae bacterium]|nr:stage III sporulation protein AB [Oscillospiraceae bacterium]